MIAPRDWPLLRILVAVAEAGSFTGAARQLGLGKSVVSLHVRTLEERCGVRLMERSTRQLRLTQVGELVLDAAREVLASVRSLEEGGRGHRDAPTGKLRVTLPLDPSLSAMVAPIAATLTRRHAALTVDLVFDDAVRDLVDGGFDVALRLGSVAASSLIVRRLASEPEIVVASPAVLDERGVPSSPKDLGGAPWVVHSGLPARSSWTLRTANGGRAQVSVAASVSANTVVALRDLLMAGAGFGVLPLHIVREDLAAGRLQHVCPGWSPRKLVLHALLPTRHAPPRVRLSWTAWPRQRRTWVSIPSSEKADGGHEEHAGCRLPCSRRGGGREMRAVDGAPGRVLRCDGRRERRHATDDLHR